MSKQWDLLDFIAVGGLLIAVAGLVIYMFTGDHR